MLALTFLSAPALLLHLTIHDRSNQTFIKFNDPLTHIPFLPVVFSIRTQPLQLPSQLVRRSATMATESDAQVYQIPIFERAKKCSISFNKYLDITKVEENNRAMNQAASFNLWIKSIGAFAKGDDSADYCLKDRPTMRDIVLDLLDLLDQTLQQGEL